MSIYYVYFHLKPDGEVFYVGMGHGKRARSRTSRSKFWKAVAKKHGFSVVIAEDGLDITTAFAREIFHIARIGRRDLGLGPLVNHTDGGDGLVNPSFATREKMRLAWANLTEAERAVRCEASRKSLQAPEVRKAISDGIKKHYEEPGAREAQSEVCKEAWNDPDRRAALSTRSKEYWADQSKRDEQARKIQEHYADPANRQVIAEKSRAQWADPEVRKRRSEGIKRKYASDPEYRKAISERSKAMWAKRRNKSKEQ